MSIGIIEKIVELTEAQEYLSCLLVTAFLLDTHIHKFIQQLYCILVTAFGYKCTQIHSSTYLRVEETATSTGNIMIGI